MFSDHDETSPVDRSSFSSVGSLFHARGAATEKALSPIRRRVRGTTRLPCTRWSTQCRSTWNMGNRCQKVWDIFRRVFQKRE